MNTPAPSSLSNYQLEELKEQLETTLKDVNSELKSRKEAEEQRRREELIPDWREQVHYSYLQGFECGVGWKDSYVPGGPLVNYHFAQAYEDELLVAKYFLSKAQHKAWHEGWNAGMKKQTELKDPRP